MIITILPSSGNFHAIAYNEKEVRQGLAFLLDLESKKNKGIRPKAFTANKLRRYFEDYSSRNTRIKNAQFHVAVSCKETEYTHQQLLEIACLYLKEMGYAEEGQPLLVYAHHDTPNNLIRIITSRIAPDGHRISDEFEKKRSRQVTLKIMKQYTGQRQGSTLNEIAAQTLAYRYTSKAQFVQSSIALAMRLQMMTTSPHYIYIKVERKSAQYLCSLSCSMHFVRTNLMTSVVASFVPF